MLSELTQYGAVAAKVRAMYGRRVTGEEYERMAAMRSVPEVASYLRSREGWGGALEGADPSGIRRDRLVYLLRRHYLLEYLRLFHYLSKDVHSIFRFPVLTAELEQIMRFMRLAAAGRSAEYVFDLPPFFNQHSKIHYGRLSSAVSYEDMLEAVRDTGFYKSLLALRPETGGFPSYLSVETAVRAYTFRELLSIVRAKSAGRTRELLLEGIGTQADWFNIVTIDRVVTHYPALRPDLIAYLLPVSARLKPAALRDLCTAPGPGGSGSEGIRAVLDKTYYGKFLRGREREPLEKSGQLYMLEFYRRHISADVPSVFTPLAFMQVYENELKNLIHVIECVRYGLPPEKTREHLLTIDN